MDALVLDQVGAPAEALAAVAADVGLLARVGTPMLHQVRVLREALAAVGAGAGALSGVRALMPQKLRPVAEALAALIADERALLARTLDHCGRNCHFTVVIATRWQRAPLLFHFRPILL